jgi:hypothetical protein
MPTNGTTEEVAARALTNEALAQRLSMLQSNRRAFDRKLADALLSEAARRLQWKTAQ